MKNLIAAGRKVCTTELSFSLLFSLLFVLGSLLVDARRFPKPDISIGFNIDHDTISGNLYSLGGAEPRVRWQTDDISIGGLFDVQGGIDLTVTDVKTLPETYVWGELKRFFRRNIESSTSTSAISIRGDIDANNRKIIDLDLRVNGFNNNVGLRVLGSADLEANSIGVDQVLADTSIDTPIIGGKLKIDPRYDLRNKVLDATIGYSFRDTALKVDCQSKELTISQNVGKNNKIIPSLIIGKRDFSLSYCRDLQEGGQVMTTWKPDDSISIQWTDGGWDAIIRAPIEGYYKTNGGIRVSMKQNVDVSL